MKRYLLTLVGIFISIFMFSQSETTVLTVPNKTTTFKKAIPVGKIIFEQDSSKFYKITGAQVSTATMAAVFTAGSYTTIGSGYITTGIFSTLEANTLNTGQGANELFDMDQNVMTSNAVTFTTVNTGYGANELWDMNQNVQTTDSPTFAGLTLTGAAGTATITTTGDITVTGAVTTSTYLGTTGYFGSTGIALLDSTISYGDEYNHSWRVWVTPVTKIPFSYVDLTNLGDVSIISKSRAQGGAQVKIIERDTSLSTATANLLNITKTKFTGKDTTGIGSTANVGTILYYNGHFYGLVPDVPPTWKQIDN